MRLNRGRGSAYKPVVAIAILFLLSSGVVPIMRSEASNPDAPLGSNLLRVAVRDEPMGLNPLAVNNVWGDYIFTATYDRVVKTDWKTEKPQPWIAVGWGFDAKQPVGCDFCNITVEYKLGDWENRWAGPVYFHDGVKASIDDVLFSYGLSVYSPNLFRDITPMNSPIPLLNPGDQNRLMTASGISSLIWRQPWSDPPYDDPGFMKIKYQGAEAWLAVKKIDEHTLGFSTAGPYGSFFDDTINIFLLPKHVWEKHINIQNGTGDYLTWDMGHDSQSGKAPGLVGSGPFSFDIWIKGQYSSLKRFDSYFNWTQLPRVDDFGKRFDPEQPAYDPVWTNHHPAAYADGITFKIYKTTEAAALAITANPPEVDFVGSSIPPTMVSDFQKNPNIGLYYTSEPGFHFLAFNMRKKTFGYEDYSGGNFTDVGKPFRKAMAYSVDKGAIVTQILQGYGKVAHGPVSPDNKEWYNDSLPKYGVNVALANKYLDDAGWNDVDGDGWRELPDIGDTQIALLTPEASYDPIGAVPGQMIATQAQRVGMNIKSVPLSVSEIWDRAMRKDFQMLILSWKIDISDPRYLYDLFHSSQGDALNLPGYHNATFDKLIEEAIKTVDHSKRVKLFKDAQAQLVEDLPYITMYYRTMIEVMRKDRFAGWVQEESGIYNHWSILLVGQPNSTVRTSFVDTRDWIIEGQSMDVTVRTTDNSGIPITGVDVTIKLESGQEHAKFAVQAGYPATVERNGSVIRGKVGPDGYFKASLIANPSLQKEEVTMSALGIKPGYRYEPAAQWTVRILLIGSLNLNIVEFTIIPNTIHLGESADVIVRVVDNIGIGVKDVSITFAATLGFPDPERTTTDGDGRTSVTYSLPKNTWVSSEGVIADINVKASMNFQGVSIFTTMTKSVKILPAIPDTPQDIIIEKGLFAIVSIIAIVVFATVFFIILPNRINKKFARKKKKG